MQGLLSIKKTNESKSDNRVNTGFFQIYKSLFYMKGVTYGHIERRTTHIKKKSFHPKENQSHIGSRESHLLQLQRIGDES